MTDTEVSTPKGSGPLAWYNLTRGEVWFLAAILVAALLSVGIRLATSRPVPAVGAVSSHPARAAIRVNTASEADLTVIPGVGPKTAEKIVEDRAKNGPFWSIADLCSRVKGLSESKLGEFAEYLDFAR